MSRPAPSTTRVLALVNLLADHPSEYLSLSEIARRLGLNKATAHGILGVLADADFVIREPTDKTYSIGPGMIRIARAALAEEFELLALARDEMETLSQAADTQCVALARIGNEIVVIGAAGTPVNPPGARLGQRGRFLPPLGVVFAAWAPAPELDGWLSGEPLTQAEQDHYRVLLHAVRERGFSAATMPEDRTRLEAAMEEVLRNISASEAEEALLAIMTELAHEENELADIIADRSYRIRQISAPVSDGSGAVRLGLALTGLPELSGAQVRDLGYELTLAAKRITQRASAYTPAAVLSGHRRQPVST